MFVYSIKSFKEAYIWIILRLKKILMTDFFTKKVFNSSYTVKIQLYVFIRDIFKQKILTIIEYLQT